VRKIAYFLLSPLIEYDSRPQQSGFDETIPVAHQALDAQQY
jgi:hypothetical protein